MECGVHICLNVTKETVHKGEKYQVTALKDSLNDRSVRPLVNINNFIRRQENAQEIVTWENKSTQTNIQ